jgi:hypothetical protein
MHYAIVIFVLLIVTYCWLLFTDDCYVHTKLSTICNTRYVTDNRKKAVIVLCVTTPSNLAILEVPASCIFRVIYALGIAVAGSSNSNYQTTRCHRRETHTNSSSSLSFFFFTWRNILSIVKMWFAQSRCVDMRVSVFVCLLVRQLMFLWFYFVQNF